MPVWIYGSFWQHFTATEEKKSWCVTISEKRVSSSPPLQLYKQWMESPEKELFGTQQKPFVLNVRRFVTWVFSVVPPPAVFYAMYLME